MTTPVLTVSGAATIFVAPDLVEFRVTTHGRAKDQDKAVDALAGRQQAVAAAVEAIGPAATITATTRISVHPVYSVERRERIDHWDASITSRVELTDLALVGRALDALRAVEHADLDGPEWKLAPGHPGRALARTTAVENGLKRAREYAAALGVRITGLVELDDTGMGRMTHKQSGWATGVAAMRQERQQSFVDVQTTPEPVEIRAQVVLRVAVSPADLDAPSA